MSDKRAERRALVAHDLLSHSTSHVSLKQREKNTIQPKENPIQSPEMKEEDTPKKELDGSSFFGKKRYKFWAIAVILILAFWSLFTGTVTLKWSAGNLMRISDHMGGPIHEDLDVLEIEEREKVVRHMWDVYTHSRRIKLPRFWQEAFEAAYENLESDVPGVREAAVSEIAKMSIRMLDLDASSRHTIAED